MLFTSAEEQRALDDKGECRNHERHWEKFAVIKIVVHIEHQKDLKTIGSLFICK